MPHPIPDSLDRTVCLQVKITAGQCVMLDGSPLPKLKKNTTADLILPAFSFEDQVELLKFTEEYEVPFLSAGSRLWVKVKTEENLEKAKAEHRITKRPYLEGDALFLPIQLQGDLDLQIRAGKHSKLGEASIHIPHLEVDAKSINEAYSKVSAVYEPSRRSHAGNVFQEVYYEHGDTLHRLNRLRLAKEMMPKPQTAPASPAAPPKSRQQVSLFDEDGTTDQA